MQTQLLSWILLTLAVATIALGVGGGVYSAFRVFEKRNSDFAATLNTTLTGVVLVLLGGCAPSLFLYVFLPALAVALFGCNFHHKSGGTSKSLKQAFLLMMTATLTTFSLYWCALVWALFNVDLDLLPIPTNGFFFYLYSLLLLVSVPFMPFLLWLYQNLSLRPGIDRHLNGNEAEPQAPIM